MSIKELIYRYFSDFIGKEKVYSVIATVDEVDRDKRVCSATPINGDAQRTGIKLQAEISKTYGLIIYPKVGSYVVISYFNSSAGFLCGWSEIDEAEIKVGEMLINIQSDGVIIQKGFVNLKTILNTAIIMTPVGPGNIAPSTLQQINELLK